MDGPPAAAHLLAGASWAAAGVAASGSRLIRRQRPPRDSAGTTGPGTALLCLACVALAAVPLLETLPAGTRPGPSQQQLHQLLFAGMLAALGVLLVTRVALVERIHRQRLRRVRQESARSHFMLDSINDGIVTEDLAGRIQFANQQFYHLFGIRPSDAVHYHFEDFIHPEDRGQVRAQYQQAVEARRDGLRIEFRGVRSDGTTLWLEGQVTPIESGGILLGRQSVLRDISRQRLIETSQRAMAQRLEFFVNKMPLGCIIWDLDFRVQEWNESAERIFGWSQSEVFRVRYVDFLVPPEDRTALEAEWRKLRESKTSGQFQCQNLTKHRGKIECEWHHTSLVDESGRVVAVASMVQDVTERKSLELQLVQSQKLEAVGTLAGGIAHDFNNLLTTILGHISLALMKLGPRHQAARGLRDAETAAERAAELTQQLLRFSRKTPVELKPIDLNQSLETVIGLLQHSIDRETDLEVSLAPQLWAVEADRGQIEQVIMNLCVNARDAIEEGGRIRVHSANRFVDEAYCRTHAQGRVGEFVEFGVSDTGCGMDEATRARVFEPFFTTKEVGKGTGLGLAMVYGIVKDHRGWVEVQSDQGQGSAFRVFLPRTHRALVSEAKALLPRLHHGVETVLLAEDEEAVRKLGLEILERHGHSVLEARDGQEAIDLFRRHRDQIGLVVLDLTMPRRTGWEAFHEVRRLKPDVPVILSSGYSLEAGPQAARQFGAEAFLPKPYKAQQLLTLVQKVLDAEHSLKGGP